MHMDDELLYIAVLTVFLDIPGLHDIALRANINLNVPAQL